MEQHINDRLVNDPLKAAEAAEMIKALGHPLRLQIIAILCRKEEHVTELARRLDVRQTIISQQLRILRNHRLVKATKIGGYAFYRLAQPRLKELIRCIASCELN